MKQPVFIICLLLLSFPVFARHVAGGELYYEYLGPGSSGNTAKYRITLRLFRDCYSLGPQLQREQVTVGIYQGTDLYTTLSMPLTDFRTISFTNNAYPCLVGDVKVCYEIGLFVGTIDLPINSIGYTLSRIGCCRIDNISNLSQSLNVGSNYVTQIPGTNALPMGFNNSPRFVVKDTALVCAYKNFTLNFGAEDTDGDVLTYSFCSAYTSPSSNSNSPPPSSLGLDPLPYAAPFSGTSPLGPNVSINNQTGIISGIAPPTGQYVVNVCVTEWRNGKAFSQHRKDFILKVQDCDLIEANLPDKIIQCDSFTVHFENQSTSSSITSYLWNFGEPSSANNVSNLPTPNHTYADTGRYKAFLTITGPNSCVGKDSTVVIVYPGFYPGFTVSGSCFQNPFNFKDTTTTKYGVVNKWNWDFGDAANITDVATTKNASYTYTSAATVNATLLVSTSKGCEATIVKPVDVLDKPRIILPFRDTLICSIDTLQLIAQAAGNYSWQPTSNLLNPTSATPLVFPKDTTVYTVTVTDNGCTNTASVKVNVLDSIKVLLGLDSAICKTDTVRLSTVSDGLGYQWQASTGEVVQPVKYPAVRPLVNTYYYVLANLGKCTARDTVLIKPVPYPVVFAGSDTSICSNTTAHLHGTIKAAYFNWSPTATLSNSNTLHPVATPQNDMLYILTVTDTLGCPKPVSDTVKVVVIPPVKVFAGNDTSVVRGQPLQLYVMSNFDNAATYLWTPSTGLSNNSSVNPIATLNITGDSIKYNIKVTTPEGCIGNDQIVVKVFKTAPEIFVPTAFTPNNDGRNDILKPIAVGVSKIDFFRVYNRWGQLLFETADFEKGWDGKINGVPQDSGTYIFVAQGRDYTGKTIFRKGTTVLIR